MSGSSRNSSRYGACIRIDRAQRLLGWWRNTTWRRVSAIRFSGPPSATTLSPAERSAPWPDGPGVMPGTASGFLRELDVGQDTVMVGAGDSYGASHRHGGSPGNQYMIQAHNR